MGRDAGRHADGDAGGAVGEKIGEGGGKDDGLGLAAVVGRAEVHRVLVDPLQQRHRHLGQAGLGVAHRRRVIAVDIAEIALTVDERIALGEGLGEADERVIDGNVAVGMELADHVAHDARALLESAGRVEAQLAHGVEQAALDGLQAVPDVGQRARGDGRERVGEVALGEGVLEIDGADLAARGGCGFAHAGLSSAVSKNA